MVAPPSDISKISAANPLGGKSLGAEAEDAARTATAKSQAPPPDRADIRPLQLSDALRILLAEIREAMDLSLLKVGEGVELDAPSAVRESLTLILGLLPTDDADVTAWLSVLPRIEQGLEGALPRALAAVNGWRELPAGVSQQMSEAVHEIRNLLLEDTPPLFPLRFEWAAYALPLSRYRRARRARRRRLLDPDYWPARLDEDEEPAR
jgi:hypothetical protein